MYKGEIREFEKMLNENEFKIVCILLFEIYIVLVKYLNIMYLKIKGIGFIMESKDEGFFWEFFE